MFAKTNAPAQAPVQTAAFNRKAPAAAFLNIYKADKAGVNHKVGAIAFEAGKAIHEVLAAKFIEDENYDPKFTFVLNENKTVTAEDIDID